MIKVMLAALLWAAAAGAATAGELYRASVGTFEADAIFEATGKAGREILIGASDEDLARFAGGGMPNSVTAWLLRANDEIVLVDTGFGRNIASALASLDLSPADVTAVLITHSHRDHIGGLTENGGRAFPNARVYAPRPEFEWSAELRAALEPYSADVTLVAPGTYDEPRKVLPGITAVASFGHTPGHTSFIVESRGERLMIWGDIMHAAAIQMPRPDVSVTYDVDPDTAREARHAALDFAARTGCAVAGMHLPFPAVGRVKRGDDGYVFVPRD